MTRLHRRTFLKGAAAASAAFPLFTVAGTKASGKVIGANDTIRVAVAGINGRGAYHVQRHMEIKGATVTYLVDPDSRLYESRSKTVLDRGGSQPTCVADIRRALDDKNVDVVSVATTNHWHALITVWSCQAGKDVYVEKPISHNVFEGRKCVEAQKKYGRVVSHGTQQRSDRSRAQQMAAIWSGKYGKLRVAKGYCCKPRWSIGQKDISAPPSELDFNLWLGPASQQPFHPNLVHYNWHWFWEFGNGDMGNQGVHEMDVARWGIKDATLPNKVWSVGGRFGYQDQGQTPNTLISVFEYPECLLVFETRGLVAGETKLPLRVENEFYTDEGRIAGKSFYPHKGGGPVALELPEVKITDGDSFASFLTAVREQKPEMSNCDAEVAHYSSALCHLGNISYRLGGPKKFDASDASLAGDKRIVESFKNVQENLAAVNLKLDEVVYQVGRSLTFDPKTESFTGDDAAAANALLTREYRAPFVVPNAV